MATIPNLFRRLGHSKSHATLAPASPTPHFDHANKQQARARQNTRKGSEIAADCATTSTATAIRRKTQHPSRESDLVLSVCRGLRKGASTFSLRTKSRRSDLRHFQPPANKCTPTLTTPQHHQSTDVQTVTSPPTTATKGLEILGIDTSVLDSAVTSISSTHDQDIARAASPLLIDCHFHSHLASDAVRHDERETEEDRLHNPKQISLDTRKTAATDERGWAKMASATATPPVSYARLKDIATTACDTVLQDATNYDHSLTEQWNNSIINAILTDLVTETTPTTASTANGVAQPQFKYVVNSTIIEDTARPAPGSAEEGGKSRGRRGMHSASGAFWNNEKDGMWAFKYEAAERKGLDVVVGIVWVWVG